MVSLDELKGMKGSEIARLYDSMDVNLAVRNGVSQGCLFFQGGLQDDVLREVLTRNPETYDWLLMSTPHNHPSLLMVGDLFIYGDVADTPRLLTAVQGGKYVPPGELDVGFAKTMGFGGDRSQTRYAYYHTLDDRARCLRTPLTGGEMMCFTPEQLLIGLIIEYNEGREIDLRELH